MPTRISQYEKIVQLGIEKVTSMVEVAFKDLGELPFGDVRMTEREEVDAYNRLRSAPGGLWNFAEGIRQELERRLSGISEEDRLVEGVGPDEVRHTAQKLTLKYAERSNRLAKKYDIPIVGMHPVMGTIPPPEETLEMAVETWPDPTTLSTQTSGTAFSAPLMAEEEAAMMGGTPELEAPILPPPPPQALESSIL